MCVHDDRLTTGHQEQLLRTRPGTPPRLLAAKASATCPPRRHSSRVLKQVSERALVHDGEIDLVHRHLPGTPEELEGQVRLEARELRMLQVTQYIQEKEARKQSRQRAPALDGARQRGDIPTLLLSALAHSLDARESHRVRHSESCSFNSSASLSAVEDNYDEDGSAIHYKANTDDECYAMQRNTPSSLAHTHRPSTTNTRSTIRTPHHRNSSVSTSSTGNISVSRSVPADCPSEDDLSDALLSSSSVCSGRHHGRKSEGAPSRSLQDSSSPPTPRIAHPVVDTTTALALPQLARVNKTQSPPTEAAPRGRSRQRDPKGRSLSSHRLPSRSPQPCAHGYQSAQARARLDSMEKVADWVAHSPVVAAGVHAACQLA